MFWTSRIRYSRLSVSRGGYGYRSPYNIQFTVRNRDPHASASKTVRETLPLKPLALVDHVRLVELFVGLADVDDELD